MDGSDVSQKSLTMRGEIHSLAAIGGMKWGCLGVVIVYRR